MKSDRSRGGAGRRREKKNYRVVKTGLVTTVNTNRDGGRFSIIFILRTVKTKTRKVNRKPSDVTAGVGFPAGLKRSRSDGIGGI